MPTRVRPMLARSGELPADPSGWAFEVKWDGMRVIAYTHDGDLRLGSRTGNDVTGQFPELGGLGAALAPHDAVLDGEVVAFDAAGRPSFQALQPRMGLTSNASIRERSSTHPVRYIAFDLLHLDGRDLRDEPYAVRRGMLRELVEDTPWWQVPPHHEGRGAELLAAAADLGLEGIVAKRLDSPYREASRTGAWTKVKLQQRQELVVCGWTEGTGRRAPTFGALLLGWHDDQGRLAYAGSVGTGFDDRTLARVRARLDELAADSSPFEVGSPEQAPHWPGPRKRGRIHYVEPQLVCEVAFTEVTRDGTLRHPSFQGLRADKLAREVVREGA